MYKMITNNILQNSIVLSKYYLKIRFVYNNIKFLRPDHEKISIDNLYYYNNLKHKKIQPMLQLKIAA